MKVQVIVKQKTFVIHCGEGGQKIKWLAQVAAIRYDPNYMMLIGQPKGIKFAGGGHLGLNEVINQHIPDESTLEIILGDDNEQYDKKKKQKKK